jgi:hypothetical protein
MALRGGQSCSWPLVPPAVGNPRRKLSNRGRWFRMLWRRTSPGWLGSRTSVAGRRELVDVARTQGSHQLHTRLPPTGLNSKGPRTSLQRPLPGLVSKRQNVKTPCARQTHHRVCRQGSSLLTYSTGTTADTTFKLAATTTSTTAPPNIPTPPSTTKTTRSGRHVRFPVRFTSLASISERGDVGAFHGNLPHVQGLG